MLIRATIIATALILGMAPATATAANHTSQDLASTHAYIQANYALARATEARVAPAQAAVETLNGRLGQECPRVGAGSPENTASAPMSYEVAVALWSTSYGIDAGPIRTFAGAVKRLHWSNSRLTHLAHSYATDLYELSTLALPDLCGDVRAWQATGFRTVPADTASLDRRVEAIEPHTVPTSLLEPYVRLADKGLLARTTRLETKLLDTETVTGFSDWDQILETLGLNQ
jgi:hypothetical protein